MFSQTQEIDCIDFNTKRCLINDESALKRSKSADFVDCEREKIVSIVTEEYNIGLLKSISSVCALFSSKVNSR